MRIAYQGAPGAYGHLAARELYPAGRLLAMSDFAAVAGAVASGKAELGILPVENSVIGPIAEAQSVLRAHDSLVVVTEADYPVRHCLLALPGAPLEIIRTVESHPAALAQCARYLAARRFVVHAVDDTAGAARRIAADRNFTCAAIASAEAAELYGLRVLAQDIADKPNNQTRFAVIAIATRAAAVA
jgi:prephenate dehydratase